jgi:hypothetical protein
MARLFADENFPRLAIERLRQQGHDVESVAEIGKGGIGWSDEEVLAYAVTQQRIQIASLWRAKWTGRLLECRDSTAAGSTFTGRGDETPLLLRQLALGAEVSAAFGERGGVFAARSAGDQPIAEDMAVGEMREGEVLGEEVEREDLVPGGSLGLLDDERLKAGLRQGDVPRAVVDKVHGDGGDADPLAIDFDERAGGLGDDRQPSTDAA